MPLSSGNKLRQVGKAVTTLVLGVLNDLCRSVAGEVSGPNNICVSFVLAGGDGVAANGRDDRGVRQGWLRADCGIGDEMIKARVFLLLDLDDSAIFEGPFEDVGLGRSSLDGFGLGKVASPVGEVSELDAVPDLCQGGFDDCGFANRGGSGD